MNTVRTFEDLEAWQMGRQLSKAVYAMTRQGDFSRDFGLRDQIQRAAVSVMSNVAEGFERGSNRDFVKFLFIARGSAGEVRSLLYVALDQGYITKGQFDSGRDLCIHSARVTWGLIKSLRTKVDWITGIKILVFSFGLQFGLTTL